MSRETYDIKEEYLGTGSVSAYTFDFKITDLEQLEIVELDDSDVETQRVRGSDVTYLSSVTFDNVAGGGTVNLTANLTTNYKLLILLADDAPLQNYEFRNKRSFTLRRFEEALDRIVGAVQRLTYRASRALKLHEIDDAIDPQLPPVLLNADRLIKVNAAGDGFDYGASVSELASAGTPLGGDDKAVLQKASAADGDVEWSATAALSGYSNRFSESFTSTDIIDTLNKILDITYAAPLISLAASGSGTVREKGDSVASTTLTATTTKTTDDFVTVEFFRAGVSIDDNTPPANVSGGTEVHVDSSLAFTDNLTYRADVTDDGAGGGPTTVSSSVSFVFVYPYYSGADVASITAAQVAALTKDIRVSTASLNKSFTSSNGDVYYYAYPASYGALTSILDENGFETFGDWTLRTENITGLDASAVSYRIYEFNNPVVAGTTDYTFIR